MKNTTDNRLTDLITGPDDRMLSEPAITSSPEGGQPVTEKGRLRLTLRYATPQTGAFMARLWQAFFIAGISLLLAGCGVWWCSHWMFDAVLADQMDPQALRVKAIWNVLMYFVPLTMVITGAVMAFVSPVLALIYLLPDPVLTRSKPAQD
ncbi:hypothetical protein NG99_03950 [Erwinia typographi]|uniref:Conjugal transfer protein TrbF n=1 Tax=Erwinia typographi TaxID=371042 RepID=A0A0A3ZCG8_9GAMM|nr:hypothetical protein [Erwinia typographi]KGT95356.1 hypothetical protein NG99_03950 [Erwinia typographi]